MKMTVVVVVSASFEMTVLEAKPETTCLTTKGMDRVTVVNEAAGQVYHQPAKFCTLGQLCARMLTLLSRSTGECCWPTYVSDGMYGLPLYDQSTAQIRLKVRMLKAEVMGTMLYGCVTWSPTVTHLAILRTAHHRLLLRCIGWKRKRRHGYRTLSYADAPAKTGI